MQSSLPVFRILIACGALLIGDAQGATLLLKNALVHTVSGPAIPNGQVLVQDGKILRVGTDLGAGADEVIDLAGQHLYPGLINPASSLGLTEVAAIRATRDFSEVGEFTPDVQSWLSVNPDSDLLPPARANGITHSLAVPMGAGLSGQSGLIQLSGWTIEDMAFKKPTAMHLFWPRMALDPTPKDEAKDKEKWKSLKEQARERRLRIKAIDDFFDEADAYGRQQHATAARVPAWEEMLPVLRGEIPLVVHANDLAQIKSMLAWSRPRASLRVILSGGRDAWRVARELADRGIAVIYDCVYNENNVMDATPMRDTEPYDQYFRAPSILVQAGVRMAIGEGLDSDAATNARNLPYAAAKAVAHGLDRDEALRALTLNPARMFGVAERLGSIEPGRDATLFACSGDILDIRSRVSRMWIAGREVNLANRQTRLQERYQARPAR